VYPKGQAGEAQRVTQAGEIQRASAQAGTWCNPKGEYTDQRAWHILV
jgi:hypothetical protein